MRYRLALLGMSLAAAANSSMAADPPVGKESRTKATYLITGLHCPPCTKTVESSLARIRGVRSAEVDWKTKMARIEFDEKVVPAQTLAQRIAATPHMMGGDIMKYDGWLALKVPEAKDEAAAKKAKEALTGVKGVKQVAVYPKQQTVIVQFDSAGRLTSEQLIDRLNEAGLRADTAFTAQPRPDSRSTNETRTTTRIAQATQADPHAGMEMDHSKMDMPNHTAPSMDHSAMAHADMHGSMGHMMGGCSMCMQMMAMSGMPAMSMSGMGHGAPAAVYQGAPALRRGYGGGIRSGRGCGCL